MAVEPYCAACCGPADNLCGIRPHPAQDSWLCLPCWNGLSVTDRALVRSYLEMLTLVGAAALDHGDDWLVEADEYVQAAYPSDVPTPEAGDLPRVLVIDVGDRCRLDWVAPGTWVGLRDGVPQQTTEGGFVRDDRHILRNLARLAGAYYLTERRAFTLTYNQIREYVKPGDIIATVKQGGDDLEVNALVTRVRYDLDAQSTTIETDFAELDVLSFVPRGT